MCIFKNIVFFKILNDKSFRKYVVCSRCVEFIRKDMLDPLTGTPMDEDDIIELQRGGTGFSATNDLKAKLVRPQLELQ